MTSNYRKCIIIYITFLKQAGFKNFLIKHDKWYGHPRDVGGYSNKSTFIWQLQFVDFVQYEVIVYIHFHFSLRFQALHGDAHNIIFVSFFKSSARLSFHLVKKNLTFLFNAKWCSPTSKVL